MIARLFRDSVDLHSRRRVDLEFAVLQLEKGEENPNRQHCRPGAYMEGASGLTWARLNTESTMIQYRDKYPVGGTYLDWSLHHDTRAPQPNSLFLSSHAKA